jgi:hypothetical protein
MNQFRRNPADGLVINHSGCSRPLRFTLPRYCPVVDVFVCGLSAGLT